MTMDPQGHIDAMRALWNSFAADQKPEWLSMEQIDRYAEEMGVGKVIESDFLGADVTTADGRHMVRFMVNGDQIGVAAFQTTGENDRDYMGDWDFWAQIGWYSTLAGAKRAAKKWMAKMGYELSDTDLNKI